MRKVPQRNELLLLLVALLVVLFIAGISFRARTAIIRGRARVVTTRSITEGATALLSSLKDAETGQRGFLLTGEDRYLDPYRQALIDIPAELKTLNDATTDIPELATLVQALKLPIQSKLDELKATIEVRQRKGLDAVIPVVTTNRGEALMDQIRLQGAELRRVANDGLVRDTDRTRGTIDLLGLVGTIGSAGLFLFLIFSTVAIGRATNRRHQLIDELQESEHRITEARDWLQTTIASIGDGVVATDAEGKVTFLNGVAAVLTGWTQEQAAGRRLEEVFVIHNEETGATVENPVSKTLREGRVQGLANHTCLTARDGRQLPIDDSAAPIRDVEGKIIGVVLVFRDITSRHESERQEKQASAALARQAELLARTNADLRQFAYSASHDLQEPLRMITMFSQLLVRGYRGQLDGEAGLCVENIVDGTRRMRDLLSDLLSYTELNADEREPASSVDLNAVCQSAIQNLLGAIEESGAVITCDSLPVLSGYEAHFIQLLQNLIGNSIKYRSEELPRIHISADQANGDWRFSVTDNGIGIAPEYQSRIFGVFKRLHGKEIPGTGIGLAICQRVVEQNGGRIWVESEAGRGATFYFTLPEETDFKKKGQATDNDGLSHAAS
ncbi:MAG TPA: CHASE3 domain-containing protein [Bryobacteraceae bacterium]